MQERANKLTGPILCLVGPPASARPRSASRSRRRPAATSCACRSAACADEAEIAVTAHLYRLDARQGTSRCGRQNRQIVFLLDEVDKMGADFRGDPSSALLRSWIPSRTILNDHILRSTTICQT